MLIFGKGGDLVLTFGKKCDIMFGGLMGNLWVLRGGFCEIIFIKDSRNYLGLSFDSRNSWLCYA